MKIGILTFHWSNNYGAALQTYAMKTYLEKNGHDVAVINYCPKYPKKKGTLESNVKDCILKVLLFPERKKIKMQKERFAKFRKEKFNLTLEFDQHQERCEEHFDCVICGSDQIWNSNLTGGKYDPFYFGKLNQKIADNYIAYAASIGERHINENYSDVFRKLLKNLKAISVREIQAVDEVQRYSDQNIKMVVDPTLLLETQDYLSVSKEVKIQKPYVLIYQNTRNDELYKIAKYISEKRGYKIVEVGYRKQFPLTGVPIVESAGPQEFLGLYKNAEFIVTNTFHGTVFAIQFKKNFISIPLKGRETRVLSLVKNLNLENRIIEEFDEGKIEQISKKAIDYNSVEERLTYHKKNSKQYLNKALSCGGKHD